MKKRITEWNTLDYTFDTEYGCVQYSTWMDKEIKRMKGFKLEIKRNPKEKKEFAIFRVYK